MRFVANKSTPQVILITAVAYIVAGRMALLLAIPPGYATAVWPAAGIALALVLLCGYRVWPGILIGSFLVNVSMGFDNSALIKSTIIPFSIGSGAALQAVVGGWLIRRFIATEPNLDTLKEIAGFIFLGAGLSSMVNATIGTGTLLVGGIITPENYSFNWATWWTGDAIGILIFTVLVMIFFSNQRAIWRPRLYTVAIPLVFCFLAVVLLFIFSSRWEVSQQRLAFERKAENVFIELEQAITGTQEVLRGMKALFLASQKVSRTEFASFVERPIKFRPGIQALEWVPHVRHKKRNAMEVLAQQEGYPEFVFTERDTNGLRPASERAEYYPVYYLEPFSGNEKALGFDLASNPSRKAAIELAIRTRSVTSTESIQLVQESGNQNAIIILLPVFAKNDADHLLGLVVVVLRLGNLVEAVITPELREGIVMTLTEINDSGVENEILTTTDLWPESVAGREITQFQWHRRLDIGNRDWRVNIVANQDLLAESRTLIPWTLLAGGLLFSGLLGAFLLFVTGETYRARNIAEELRNTLHELEVAQSQLVESEKLASLGGMMSGMAHELNTPIGIAVTAVSTLEDQAKIINAKMENKELSTTDFEQFLNLVKDAGNIAHGNLRRTAQLIKSFKDVSVDRATDEVRDINLADYLEEILIYMRPTYKKLPHKVELKCSAGINITTAPGALSQVVINFLNNSLMHAFEEGVHGNILISAEILGDKVRLVYTDDGKGIPEADLQKVYEPFYTTRKGRGGTGLGLHLVREIVKQKLQGSITLVSALGKGVRFEIELPRKLA